MNGEQKELLDALDDKLKQHTRRSDNVLTSKNAAAILVPLLIAAVLWWFKFGQENVTAEGLERTAPRIRERPGVLADLEQQGESIDEIKEDVDTISAELFTLSMGQAVAQSEQREQAEDIDDIAEDVEKILDVVRGEPR